MTDEVKAERLLTLYLLDPPEPGEVQAGGHLTRDGQLVDPSQSYRQFQPLKSRAAVIKAWLVRLIRHAHVQVELFQGPGVGLGNALPGGRDEGIRVEQS